MTKRIPEHQKALWLLRHKYLGRKLSYREMAEMLTAFSGVYIQKSNVWNAMKRAKKCPKPIRLALERMELMKCRPRRWRFFYETTEEEYRLIQAGLIRRNYSFTDWMNAEVYERPY